MSIDTFINRRRAEINSTQRSMAAMRGRGRKNVPFRPDPTPEPETPVTRHMDYTVYMEAIPDNTTDYVDFLNLWAGKGFNRFIFGTPWYDGTAVAAHAGIEAVMAAGDSLQAAAVGSIPARPVEVGLLTIKMFKNAMSNDLANKGYLTLNDSASTNLMVGHSLTKTTDTITPGQINLTNSVVIGAGDLPRLYRLSVTVTGASLSAGTPLEIRTYPTNHGWGKHLEQFVEAAGDYTFDFPIFGTTGTFIILFRNFSAANAGYTITGFQEVAPNPLESSTNGDGTFKYFGQISNVGYAGFPFLHGRLHEDATVTRFMAEATSIYNLFGGHSCFGGFWANGDELYCIQNEAGYANIGHLVYNFIQKYSDEIYTLTGKPLGLWTLNYDPNYADGYYACDMTNGGLHAPANGFLSRLNGLEYVDWTDYEYGLYTAPGDPHQMYHAQELAILLGKGYDKVRQHLAVGDGSVDVQCQDWCAQIATLSADEQSHCGGPFAYCNNLAQATEANADAIIANFPPLY